MQHCGEQLVHKHSGILSLYLKLKCLISAFPGSTLIWISKILVTGLDAMVKIININT